METSGQKGGDASHPKGGLGSEASPDPLSSAGPRLCPPPPRGPGPGPGLTCGPGGSPCRTASPPPRRPGPGCAAAPPSPPAPASRRPGRAAASRVRRTAPGLKDGAQIASPPRRHLPAGERPLRGALTDPGRLRRGCGEKWCLWGLHAHTHTNNAAGWAPL